MGKPVKVLIAFFAVVIIVLVGVMWYFSSIVLYPNKTGCSKNHFVYCGDPSEIGLRFETVTFKSVDGMNLRGWYIPAGDSGRAIVYVHGRSAERHEGMRWVKSWHKAGFNILLFDLRNTGESDPSFNSMGFHEKKDVLAAVEYMYKEKKMKAVGIFGVSQGAASGIAAMTEDTRIRAGVFEAGFANVTDIFAEVAKKDFGLSKFPIVDMAMWLFELRGGVDLSKVHPENNVGKIAPRPVYIIHCRDDDYIDVRHGQRIFAAAKEPKTYYEASCTKHAEAWQSDRAYLEKTTAEFYDKNVR